MKTRPPPKSCVDHPPRACIHVRDIYVLLSSEANAERGSTTAQYMDNPGASDLVVLGNGEEDGVG